MSIPASEIVTVNPGVITAGGSAVDLNGLILTNTTAIPLGTVAQFPTAQSVSDFFGPASNEYSLASIYFSGFNNSLKKPGNLLMATYPTASVPAYLRSGSFAGYTLAQIQAITPGVLTVTVDGVVKTSSTINLASATSFSNAAALINAAFTGGPLVGWDAQLNTFTAVSTTTGNSSTITFGSGTISTALKMTQAAGAVLSQGSVAYTPATAMTAIATQTLNWAGLMTTFEPLLADKLAFATWVSQQNSRYVYACWDTDSNAIVSGNTTCFGAQVKALTLSGSVPIYKSASIAAFVLGSMASLDFTQTNGRQDFSGIAGSGLTPDVTDVTISRNLLANGYNFYGLYATNNATQTFYNNGSIGGPFTWMDSYVNQINLNSNCQNALLSLLINSGSIPYNAAGYAQIETALLTPINDALNFGTIRTGVTLSGSQIAAVNAAAGKKIDTVLSTRGWYLLIQDPSPSVRASRGSPPMKLFYMDGGSIQQLTLASIAIQ